MLKKRVAEIALMNLDKIPHDKVGVRLDGHAARSTASSRSSTSS